MNGASHGTTHGCMEQVLSQLMHLRPLPQGQLASAQAALGRGGADLEAWRAAVAARDAEIQNLQVGATPA